MNRRQVMWGAASAALAALSVKPQAAFAGPGVRRKNVILIEVDDLDDIAPADSMPITQAKLARRGIVFANSFVDVSSCTPSRVSMLTGLGLHNHHISGNHGPDGGWPAFRSSSHYNNNLLSWAHDRGYKVGMMGKIMNDYFETEAVPPYVDDWHVECSTKTPFDYFGPKINDNGVINQYHKEIYFTDLMSDNAMAFLDSHGAHPFFLNVWPIAAHGSANNDGGVGQDTGLPSPAPRHVGAWAHVRQPHRPDFNEKDVSDKPRGIAKLPLTDPIYDEVLWQARRETMMAVDEMIGRIIDKLTALNVLDQTYIIFTSDNGFMLGEHRWQNKVLLYEESMRVPLIICGPGIPATGQVLTNMVNNLDVTATLVDIMGLGRPGYPLDGTSLAPLFDGGATVPWRSGLLFENGRSWGIRTPTELYAENKHDISEYYDFTGAVTGVRPDPFENRNAIGNPSAQARIAELTARLAGLRPCRGRRCWLA